MDQTKVLAQLPLSTAKEYLGIGVSLQRPCNLRFTGSFSSRAATIINSATGATRSMLWSWASLGLSRSIVCDHLTTFEDKLGLNLIGRLVPQKGIDAIELGRGSAPARA